MTFLRFAPLLSLPVLMILATIIFMALGIAFFRKARGTVLRTACALALFFILCGPQRVHETRLPQDDILLILRDASPSMALGNRRAQADAALASLHGQAESLAGLMVKDVPFGQTPPGSLPVHETRLMDLATDAMADLPADRLAGIIILTDGQVVDAPESAAAFPAPVHVLLTGQPAETDRRITLENAPAYGMVGQDVPLAFSINDTPASQIPAHVRLVMDGTVMREMTLATGRTHQIMVPIPHAGASLVTLECDPLPGETSLANNRAAFTLSGIRDRLKVLLVSGVPSPGERAWRNLLKSDPSVDLVHFTILRPPERPDPTPESELSLIHFPAHELFFEKTREFDLIILDQYRAMAIMLPPYLANMADYVREGGALLVAAGPEFSDPATLSRTPLGAVLPANPAGPPAIGPFTPALTRAGQRHPVTQGLDAGPPWGRFMRYLPTSPQNQTAILMQAGNDNAPLLLLARMEEGRSALIASDQLWLWARKYEGGGPHDDLLRRLVHWLMKEPDLEENALRMDLAGNQLVLGLHSMDGTEQPVSISTPSGKTQTLSLIPDADGWSSIQMPVEELGVFEARTLQEDGTPRRTFLLAGPPAAPETMNVLATDSHLSGLAKTTGGSLAWLANTPDPVLVPTLSRPNGTKPGQLALWRRNAHLVTGSIPTPFPPAGIALAFLFILALSAWITESRKEEK
ncbi:MAG TPA: hypothetical protein DCW68_04190 [Rhodospirillaceae bacterium]|nr:MAG: hypothetical protein A2018_07375 [Alphaproteobacteria bacterium GWF2_58_20]HAU29295.1 hypothetical protein [Rhodospirillaceae bacterium]